jgi:S1-C subfamily serine protease
MMTLGNRVGEVCMTRVPTFLATAFIVAITASSASAKGPFGSIHVGQWTGGAYTFDNTGGFSHCAAVVPYLNGIFLLLSQAGDSTWTLSFADPKFSLTIGDTFPIDLTFDGRSQVRLFGTAIQPIMVTAVLPPNALNEIRKSHLMVAQAKGSTFQFKLVSTGVVIPTITNCVAKTKAAGVSNVGDFSIPVSNPPATKEAVRSAPTSEPAKSEKKVLQNGTGFVVSATGHIVTSNHVIDGCVGDIRGNLTGEAASTLRVVSTDETNDLALLQVAKTFNEVAKIRATAARSGDQVVAIGYPYHGLLTSDVTVTTGIVSSLSGVLNDTRFLQISAAIQPGNSGGPLLDTSGYVVGVIAAKINALRFAKVTGDLPENINFAVKTGAMRDFLDNSVVSYQTAEPKSELKTAEIAQNARAFTMFISCEAKEKK